MAVVTQVRGVIKRIIMTCWICSDIPNGDSPGALRHKPRGWRLRHESCQPTARPNYGRDLKLASLYYRALKLSGVNAVARRLSNAGIVLCYHNVVAETDANAPDTLGLHMPLAP